MARGKFITFEGIDGAGKTTHLSWFRERVEEKVAAAGLSGPAATTRFASFTPSRGSSSHFCQNVTASG